MSFHVLLQLHLICKFVFALSACHSLGALRCRQTLFRRCPGCHGVFSFCGQRFTSFKFHWYDFLLFKLFCRRNTNGCHDVLSRLYSRECLTHPSSLLA